MYYLKRTTIKQGHWHWFNRVNQTAASNLHLWITGYPGAQSVVYTSEGNAAYCTIKFDSLSNLKQFEIALMSNPDNIIRSNYHTTAGTIDTYDIEEIL